MRNATCSILTAGALLTGVGLAAAQAPEGIRTAVLVTATPPAPPISPSPLAVIERVMSFDANKDLQLSRDELPERMQGLIARGDRNADGILDFEELRTLVNAAASVHTRIAFHRQPSEGLAGVIDDLKLPPGKHEQALAIVRTYEPPAGNVPEKPASSAVAKAMRSLLDDEEYENFIAAATRLSKTARLRMGTFDTIERRLRR